MSLSDADIASLAERLENAELNKAPITKITNDFPDMDWNDAYQVRPEFRPTARYIFCPRAARVAKMTSKHRHSP